MKVVQARFISGTTHLTAWVENRIKAKNLVSFKDEPDRFWLVESIDSEPTEQSSINRGWNNNI